MRLLRLEAFLGVSFIFHLFASVNPRAALLLFAFFPRSFAVSVSHRTSAERPFGRASSHRQRSSSGPVAFSALQQNETTAAANSATANSADQPLRGPFLTIGEVEFPLGSNSGKLKVYSEAPSIAVFTAVANKFEGNDAKNLPLAQVYPTKGDNSWDVSVKLSSPCGRTPATGTRQPFLHWLAVRPGMYTFAKNNATILAALTSVKFDGAPQTIPLTSEKDGSPVFSKPPLILAQVQLKTGSSDPYIHPRIVSVDQGSFSVAIETTLDGAGSGGLESVAWMAFEETTYSLPAGLLSGVLATTSTNEVYKVTIPNQQDFPSQCGKVPVFAADNNSPEGDQPRHTVPNVESQTGQAVDLRFAAVSCQPEQFQSKIAQTRISTLVYQPSFCMEVKFGDVVLASQNSGGIVAEESTSYTLIFMLVGGVCGLILVGALLFFCCRSSAGEPPQEQQQPGYGQNEWGQFGGGPMAPPGGW